MSKCEFIGVLKFTENKCSYEHLFVIICMFYVQ